MASQIQQIYQTNLSLLTDLYQLTMANGYFINGMQEREAVFHLYFRKNPFKGNYAIACGLDFVIDFISSFHFDVDSIQYLASLKGGDGKALFSESFLNYLQRLEFSCDVDAIVEGTLVFPNEPLVRIRGPLIQCQLLETTLLTLINFSTLVATKSSRIVHAAKGDPVLEFGLRRAQGPDGGLSASRAAFIGGCEATSNVLAGQLFDIPVKGTHAHSWVMSFDTELESFEAYAKAMPNNCVFLVDTFDTYEGVKKAIVLGKALKERGYRMHGIRLDSGDLAELSIQARQLLDEAGFTEAQIVASNDLDEYRIKQLKSEGAKITVWGVGTRLSTCYDQPALGGVYKLAALENAEGKMDFKVKLSEQAIKTSNPGIQQVRRFFTKDGEGNLIPESDVIYHEGFDCSEKYSSNSTSYEDLLKPIFRKGKLVYSKPSIHTHRTFCLNQVDQFSFIFEKPYEVSLETKLAELKKKLIEKYSC